MAVAGATPTLLPLLLLASLGLSNAWSAGPSPHLRRTRALAPRHALVSADGSEGGADGNAGGDVDLEFALRAAIEIEDYAEASRLKKAIDAAREESTETQRAADDAAAADLVDNASVDRMLASAGESGLVVLHFTSAEHAMSNALVARTATRFASSQLVGGPVCGFVQLSEAGFERLGKAETWVDPRKRGAPAAAAEPPPPPADGLLPGWKEATDKEGRVYYYNTKTKETSWERPISEARRAAAMLCSERGVQSLPTTQVWQGGELLREVSSMELEKLLLELGARSVDGSGGVATGNEQLYDRNRGTGLPDANAVDNIDFTGGIAGAGGTTLDRFKGRDRGTTRSYLPDWVDKPGDDMKGDDAPGKDGQGGGPGTLRRGPQNPFDPKRRPTA